MVLVVCLLFYRVGSLNTLMLDHLLAQLYMQLKKQKEKKEKFDKSKDEYLFQFPLEYIWYSLNGKHSMLGSSLFCYILVNLCIAPLIRNCYKYLKKVRNKFTLAFVIYVIYKWATTQNENDKTFLYKEKLVDLIIMFMFWYIYIWSYLFIADNELSERQNAYIRLYVEDLLK